MTDLPGWPLLSPSKVQMQKCDKCSREFCSTINYRRHIRVHRKSLNIDKVSFFLSIDKSLILLITYSFAWENLYQYFWRNVILVLCYIISKLVNGVKNHWKQITISIKSSVDLQRANSWAIPSCSSNHCLIDTMYLIVSACDVFSFGSGHLTIL